VSMISYLRSVHFTRTPSAVEPVTVEEARRQLRIDHTDDDDDLALMISEARLDCETRLGDVSLVTAACIDYFDWFADPMELHWSPVSAITSITYVDANGATQTLAGTYYELGTKLGRGLVRRKYGQNWPTTRDYPDVVAVTYSAGFGAAASSVPKNIKRWILARVAWLYANRDGEEYPWGGFDSILSPHRIVRVLS